MTSLSHLLRNPLGALTGLAVVLLAAVWVGAFAAPAQAQPAPPFLSGTSPASPGATTTPRLVGRDSGVGTSGVLKAVLPVTTAAIDANAIVNVYADPGCGSGSLLATGTLGELEGPGIEVTVAANATTHLYATLTDPAEPNAPSACSSGVAYRHVSSAPPAPTVSGVVPASPADDNAPRVSGTAEAEATVSIHGDAACAGQQLAVGSGAAFATTGIPVPVPDNSTTTFYAKASWGGMASSCSASSVTFQEVTVAPPGGEPPGGEPSPPESVPADPVPAPVPGRPAPPKLHTVPGGRANNTIPLVAGSAPDAARVAIFASDNCSGGAVASGSAAELRAGLPVRVAANSTTAFTGVSIAPDGDRSRCSPEPVVYVEDSLPPLTRITFGPGAKTRKRAPVFRFADLSGEPPGTVFLCKVNRRPWRPCQSPLKLKRLRPRKHVLRVLGIDAAGNREAAAAKRAFRVIRAGRR